MKYIFHYFLLFKGIESNELSRVRLLSILMTDNQILTKSTQNGSRIDARANDGRAWCKVHSRTFHTKAVRTNPQDFQFESTYRNSTSRVPPHIRPLITNQSWPSIVYHNSNGSPRSLICTHFFPHTTYYTQCCRAGMFPLTKKSNKPHFQRKKQRLNQECDMLITWIHKYYIYDLTISLILDIPFNYNLRGVSTLFGRKNVFFFRNLFWGTYLR